MRYGPVALVLAVSAALIGAYIANSPHLDRFGDSAEYERLAGALPSSFVSAERMPGFPVLIAFSSWLPGGLIVTQSLLTLAAVILTYAVARSALGARWMAVLASLVVAADLLLFAYVRVVMSETLAVFLAIALTLAVLRYLVDFRAAYAWLAAGLTVALLLTRAEWAFLPVVLVPYLILIALRRGRLSRSVLVHTLASGGAVLVAAGAYATANLANNDYFGLTSVTNVALIGKVMVYGMAPEAPGKYADLAAQVAAAPDAWTLVTEPPFNDPNSKLAGDFARATIEHDPLRFAQDVLGTAITTAGEHDSEFVRIDGTGPFGRPLQVLLAVDQSRYRAFVLLTALALAWALAPILRRRSAYQMAALGVLGAIALYDWFITAAGTFWEFERVRMPTNAIATVIVLGTFLLTLRLAITDRRRRIPAAGLIALQAAAIAFLPRITSAPLSGLAIVVIAAIHLAAFMRWSPLLFEDQPDAG